MKRVLSFFCGCLLLSCQTAPPPGEDNTDYRQEMRRLVIDLSAYARLRDSDFILIPQNGQELISGAARDYMESIDGTGREDLNFGYTGDNRRTPEKENESMLALCRMFASRGKTVLVIDYCRDESKADMAFAANEREGFLSFAAPDRNLRQIPPYPETPRHTGGQNITSLGEGRNFLYLINDDDYRDREDLLRDLRKTDYDILIIDLCFQESFWTAS